MNVASLPPRIQEKVTVHPISDCWEWRGARNGRGYGSVTNGLGSSALAHRVAYEALVGPIPAGLTIDHLCRNKVCLNAAHMEPVTREENSRRQVRRPVYATVAREPRPSEQSLMDLFAEMVANTK